MRKFSWILALLVALTMVFVGIGCDNGSTSKKPVDPDPRPWATAPLEITDEDEIGALLSGSNFFSANVEACVSTDKNVAHFNFAAGDSVDNNGFKISFPQDALDKRYTSMTIDFELVELTTIAENQYVKIGFKESAFPDAKVDMEPYSDYEFFLGTPTAVSKVGDKATQEIPLYLPNKAPKNAVWFFQNSYNANSGPFSGKKGSGAPINYKLKITKIVFGAEAVEACCTECDADCKDCNAGKCEGDAKCGTECCLPWNLDVLKALDGGITVTPVGDALPVFDSASKVSKFTVVPITPPPGNNNNTAPASGIQFTWADAGITNWAAIGGKQSVKITYAAIIESGSADMTVKDNAGNSWQSAGDAGYPTLADGPSTVLTFTKTKIGAASTGLTFAVNSWNKPNPAAVYHVKILKVEIAACPDCEQAVCICLPCDCFCAPCITAAACDGTDCTAGCECICHISLEDFHFFATLSAPLATVNSATVAASTFADGKLTINFTAENQVVCFAISEANIAKINDVFTAGEKVGFKVYGYSLVKNQNLRVGFRNPDTGSDWAGALLDGQPFGTDYTVLSGELEKHPQMNTGGIGNLGSLLIQARNGFTNIVISGIQIFYGTAGADPTPITPPAPTACCEEGCCEPNDCSECTENGECCDDCEYEDLSGIEPFSWSLESITAFVSATEGTSLSGGAIIGPNLVDAGATLSVVKVETKSAIKMEIPSTGHAGWRGLDIASAELPGGFGFREGDVVTVGITLTSDTSGLQVILRPKGSTSWGANIGGNPSMTKDVRVELIRELTGPQATAINEAGGIRIQFNSADAEALELVIDTISVVRTVD